MAKRESWSVRPSSDRRRTLWSFAAVYGLICIVAVVFGWVPIAIIFGLGAAGLAIAGYLTGDGPEPTTRPTPEWMRSIEDPDAPDLSLPEYRERPVASEVTRDEPGGRPPVDPGPTPPPTPTA